MKILTEFQLRKLSTRNLLAYLRSLHKCRNDKDWDEDFLIDGKNFYFGNTKFYKNSEEWRNLYSLVKSILSEREHIERKR